MYTQELKHKLKFEVINHKPKITLGIRFNDLFTQDTYVLVSENTKYFDKNKIPFSIFINNEKTKSVFLNNFDGVSFINESFNDINDYDFKEFLTEKIKNAISLEIKNNIEYFEKQVILNELSIDGELLRMKELSGISKKILS